MNYLINALLLATALAHALPAAAFVAPALLEPFYGVRPADPGLEVLLRHRALLFAIVAGLLVLGACRPAYRVLALVVGSVSVASFIYLALLTQGTSATLLRVAYVDAIIAAGLAVASLLHALGSRSRAGPTASAPAAAGPGPDRR